MSSSSSSSSSSSNGFDTGFQHSFDFPDMEMFDNDDEFPIHETLQREDLEMFSFENETTQGRQQVVEEAKFFWRANRGSSSSSSSSGESIQQMQSFLSQTIASAQ